ncbi:MAG TPA: pyridoxal phosphate-dependent aminotransferase [Candidatus Acidoferrales bacterium]|nr:pyridoxal phosphate-dependent aminotransferase [Candidatus Acidoferrales bacterium]
MNPAVVSTGGSLIRALNARKKATSIDLGLGEPTLAPDIAYFEEAVRWVAEHGCHYTANVGDAHLRAAIARYYDYPAMRAAENVCITTGSQEALYVVVKTMLDPAKDELLLVEPAFSVYDKLAAVEGIALQRVSMPAQTGFAFDAQRILEALTPRTRLILICSPCNPTGRVVSRAEVAKITRALGERGGAPIYILHDEIYRELVYTEDAGSFGESYPYTIAINSLSKSNALTGLRIGWFMAPSEAMGELVKMHSWATSCASTVGQVIAARIFAEEALGVQQPWYAAARDAAMSAARDAGLPYVVPDGAFYLCVDVGVEDDVAFAYRLIDECDVVAIPGSNFGSASRGWLRTSFVGPPEALREGFTRIASLRATYEGAVRPNG